MYGPEPRAGVRVDASKSTLLSVKYFSEKIGNPPTVLIKSLLGTSSLKINFISETQLGSDFDYIEAELIAYLSARSFYNLPFTFPSTTGVLKPLSGGKLFKYL